MLGLRVSVDPDIQADARAGRCGPTNLLSPAHGDGDQGVNRGAVRVGGHAAWVVCAFAPQAWCGRLLPHLGALRATLRRKPVAHAVSGISGCGVEQQYRRDREDLEERSHEGENRVYPANAGPQEIPLGRPAFGGVKPGWRVQDVGWWERREYRLVVWFHPPSRSGGQHPVLRFYSAEGAGISTTLGKPGIELRRRPSRPSKPPICAAARPT